MWLAEQRRPFEVAQLVREKLGKEITWDGVKYYTMRKRWRRIIQHLEARFLTQLIAIPIANKAVRLRRYETLYHEAMTLHTIGMTKGGEPIDGIDLHAARGVLQAARQEMDGLPAGAPGAAAIASAEINVTINSMVEGVKQIVERRRLRVVQAAVPVAVDTNGHEHGHDGNGAE